MGAARAVSAPLARLPNALTVLRLAFIPLFVLLVLETDGRGSWLAAGVFAAAGVTDQVDGWLARRWRVESEFGKFADPLADRLMIDAAVILLWLDGRLPWPGLALILARDGVLLLGYAFVKDKGYDFSVNFLGKAATWILYAALAFLLAFGEDVAWPLWIFWIGLGVAVAAAGQYVVAAVRSVRGS